MLNNYLIEKDQMDTEFELYNILKNIGTIEQNNFDIFEKLNSQVYTWDDDFDFLEKNEFFN